MCLTLWMLGLISLLGFADFVASELHVSWYDLLLVKTCIVSESCEF